MTHLGFSYELQGQFIIFYRHGLKIKQIKGLEAQKFIEFTQVQSDENIQIQIAKLTGNYKRGNERKARNHPR
ncbi:MAG: hypothetical protein GPJ54_15680, partial [Candidatus Heimdallarchaeota archaeon]|nr:hypothetical protein [Candidatus Heimdallarchaeota archaeon]